MKKICSRGHEFEKSSDCPVCPICWPGQKKKILQGDLPNNLSAPALRALDSVGIKTLAEAAKWSEKELLALHGFGPKGFEILASAIREKKL